MASLLPANQGPTMTLSAIQDTRDHLDRLEVEVRKAHQVFVTHGVRGETEYRELAEALDALNIRFESHITAQQMPIPTSQEPTLDFQKRVAAAAAAKRYSIRLGQDDYTKLHSEGVL